MIKPVAKGDRIIANIHNSEYVPFLTDSGETDGLVLQLDKSKPIGTGFHVYKMEPGQTTIPHQHRSHEEFLLLSGDIKDNDGTEYQVGDLVLMKKGTEHCSTTVNGCLLAVFIQDTEQSL